ncbi:M23 family metallopeptidase, partial [Treponema pallidum]
GYSRIYGNYLIIVHGGGYQTMYGHLSSVMVGRGARVVQGTTIGRVGASGRATGPHLHFSVFKNGSVVNPLKILTK